MKKIRVVINGPSDSKAAIQFAEAVINSNCFELVSHPFADQGEPVARKNMDGLKILSFPMIKPIFFSGYQGIIIVDFTVNPSVMDNNINIYCKNGWNYLAQANPDDYYHYLNDVRLKGLNVLLVPEIRKHSFEELSECILFLNGRKKEGKIFTMADLPILLKVHEPIPLEAY